MRFNWKETGTPSLGLIAEEVAAVYPELVQFDAATGAAEAVNYAALVAVLIEGYRGQQAQIEAQDSELLAYHSLFAQQQAELARMQARLDQIEARQARVEETSHRHTAATRAAARGAVTPH